MNFLQLVVYLNIAQVLQIMKTSTNILSSGELPTVSIILPLKASIMKQMKSDTDGTIPVIREAKMTIWNDLETRYVLLYVYV